MYKPLYAAPPVQQGFTGRIDLDDPSGEEAFMFLTDGKLGRLDDEPSYKFGGETSWCHPDYIGYHREGNAPARIINNSVYPMHIEWHYQGKVQKISHNGEIVNYLWDGDRLLGVYSNDDKSTFIPNG
jgi:hypothetical protein